MKIEKDIIVNTNSIEYMNSMPEESVDLIFADPPYWMRVEGQLNRVEGSKFDGCDDEWDQFNSSEDYEKFTRDWLTACYRILKPNGSIWVIGGMQCIYTIGAIMQNIGYWFINDVIWHKKNPTPNFMGTRLNNSHETLIWATKSKKSKFKFNYKTAKELNTDTVNKIEFEKGIRKQMGSVWSFSVCSGNERLKDDNGDKLHSTQKPLEMLERIIAISSNKNDIVLDPFGGTMTTGAAAKRMGRHYIMLELEKKYCNYGRKRLDKIKVEDDDIINAVYDIKPIKVKFTELIDNNYLQAGESFYLKKGEKKAVLLKNGKINLEEEIVDIHSGAAKAKNVKSDRLNGFNHWYVMRNGKLTSISDVREDYRKFKISKQKTEG